MSEGDLVRVQGEFLIPADVWQWIEEQVRGRLFRNEADAISFLVTEAKRRNDHARGVVEGGFWPTSAERSAGRMRRG